MSEVHWFEADSASVPADDGWLARCERSVLAELRFAKRRSDWRLGRWTAKRALARRLDWPDEPRWLRELEVRAADDGAPEAWFRGGPIPFQISISHSAGRALCALAPTHLRLGCDLERIERRSLGFLEEVLVRGERARVASSDEPELVATLLFSAKESALKALRCGLRRDLHDVAVAPAEADASGDWRPLALRCAGEPCGFAGWWRRVGSQVWTVVADAPFPRPLPLTRR